MMRFYLRTVIALVLLSFAAGFITCFLVFEDHKVLKPGTSKDVSIKSLAKEANQSDASYQKQIEKLTSQNLGLQQQMNLNQGLLDDVKRIAGQKEAHIKQLIKQNRSSTRSYRTNQNSYLSTGQTRSLGKAEVALLPHEEYNYCDSLEQEVTSYIDASNRKDSIYEVQLIQFDSLLSGKDSIIRTSGKAYTELHLLFEEAVSKGVALQKDNIALRKENKRQRFKTKLFAGGLMILSGFATQIFLH